MLSQLPLFNWFEIGNEEETFDDEEEDWGTATTAELNWLLFIDELWMIAAWGGKVDKLTRLLLLILLLLFDEFICCNGIYCGDDCTTDWFCVEEFNDDNGAYWEEDCEDGKEEFEEEEEEDEEVEEEEEEELERKKKERKK